LHNRLYRQKNLNISSIDKQEQYKEQSIQRAKLRKHIVVKTSLPLKSISSTTRIVSKG